MQSVFVFLSAACVYATPMNQEYQEGSTVLIQHTSLAQDDENTKGPRWDMMLFAIMFGFLAVYNIVPYVTAEIRIGQKEGQDHIRRCIIFEEQLEALKEFTEHSDVEKADMGKKVQAQIKDLEKPSFLFQIVPNGYNCHRRWHWILFLVLSGGLSYGLFWMAFNLADAVKPVN
jgi:hypothetical protein